MSEECLKNPWLVDSILEFSRLKCPECPFSSKKEQKFKKHALANHPLSKAFFKENIKVNSRTAKVAPVVKNKTELQNIPVKEDISIKEEPNDDFESQYYDEPEVRDNFM